MRLPDTEELGRLSSSNATLLEEIVNLQRELSFDQLVLRVGKAQVGEDILTAEFPTNPWRYDPPLVRKKWRHTFSTLRRPGDALS
jgi:hypothetical protein